MWLLMAFWDLSNIVKKKCTPLISLNILPINEVTENSSYFVLIETKLYCTSKNNFSFARSSGWIWKESNKIDIYLDEFRWQKDCFFASWSQIYSVIVKTKIKFCMILYTYLYYVHNLTVKGFKLKLGINKFWKRRSGKIKAVHFIFLGDIILINTLLSIIL